jgi:hypothetical protein
MRVLVVREREALIMKIAPSSDTEEREKGVTSSNTLKHHADLNRQ